MIAEQHHRERRAVAEIQLGERGAIGVEVQDLGRRARPAAGGREDRRERRQRRHRAQDHDHHDRRPDQRQRDVAEALPRRSRGRGAPPRRRRAAAWPASRAAPGTRTASTARCGSRSPRSAPAADRRASCGCRRPSARVTRSTRPTSGASTSVRQNRPTTTGASTIGRIAATRRSALPLRDLQHEQRQRQADRPPAARRSTRCRSRSARANSRSAGRSPIFA